MNGKYNQPTAHMLQPVKGWDSMAHLDFVAPIAAKVQDALPGTVMHLNSFGELEVGLTAQGMGMYLFYKMWDEDVQPYPLTQDGTRMTAVGMQSFGGYNSEVYLRTWDDNSYNTNGHASNVGAYNFNADGSALSAKVKAGAAAHTTYPAICGMELSSTEFAWETGAGTSIQYYPNDTLTSPEPAAFDATLPGKEDQQLAGGFLKKGVCYKDPICGIVSKKPVINEHGYRQICFWSCWLPALSKDAPQSGAALQVAATGDLQWVASSSDSTAFDTFFTLGYNDKGTTKPFTPVAAATTVSYDNTKENVYYVRIEPTNSGAVPQEAAITATINGAAYVIGDDAVSKVSMSMQDQQTVKVKVEADATVSSTVKFTYNGLDSAVITFSKAA